MTTPRADPSGSSRENAGPPPPVPLAILTFHLSGSVGYILIFLAVILGIVGWWNARAADRLDRYGVVTEGQMWTEYLGQRVRREENRPPRTVHRVQTTIEFQDEAGETHRSTSHREVQTQPRTAISARQPVTVRYDPRNPSVLETGRVGKKGEVSRNAGQLAILCLVGAAGFFGWGAYKAMRAIRVREKGRRLRVKARGPPPEAKEDDFYKLHWKTDDGLSGVSLRPPKKEEGIKPGTTIRVYTDGKSTWWEGDVGSPKGG